MRSLPFLTAFAAASLSLAAPAIQESALRLKVATGDAFVTTTAIRSTGRNSFDTDLTSKLTVSSVDAQGNFVFRNLVTDASVKSKAGGQLAKMFKGNTITLTLSPRAEIVSAQAGMTTPMLAMMTGQTGGLTNVILAMAMDFPEKPVHAGDSWKAMVNPEKLSGGMSGQMGMKDDPYEMTYTVAGFEKLDGTDVAKVVGKGESHSEMSASGQSSITVSQITETHWVDLATGLNLKVAVHLDTKAKGMGKSDSKSDIEQTLKRA